MQNDPHQSVQQETIAYGKPVDGFKKLTTSLEPSTLQELGTDRTPIDQFFTCAGSAVPMPGADWTMSIDGDAVDTATTVSLAQLRALPQHSVTSWLECAGNGRAMYEVAGGYSEAAGLADTGWTLGGMGIATWSGPRLSDVLARAGIIDSAAFVGPEGLDIDNREGEAARMSLPLEKALHPDTLVALDMNDAPLSPAHGHPARLLVPGWVGAYSVKWLDRLEVSTEWIPSWRADVYYVHRLADGTKLGPATTHPIKSCLTAAWGDDLSAGLHQLQGYARSGEGRIERVEISIDDGPWMDAELERLDGEWTWVPFHFDWEATPGDHQIRTRAWDTQGRTQPDHVDFHPNTILWNAVTRHPLTIT